MDEFDVIEIRKLGLERFHQAQEECWENVLAELAEGMKRTHWSWFVFPQPPGLGRSAMTKAYAVDEAEAHAYWDDPVLRRRLLAAVGLVYAWAMIGRAPEDVLGEIDALKFRSCTELFAGLSGHPLLVAASEL